MTKINSYIFLLLLSFFVATVNAQTRPLVQIPQKFLPWVVGVHYSRLSEDAADLNDDMAAIVPSIGYRFPLFDKLEVIPTLTLGKGIEDDDAAFDETDIRIRLDNLIILSAKLQYEVPSWQVYGYLAPSLADFGYNIENSQNGFDMPDIDDGFEFGLGVGLGYKLARNISAELLIEQYDDTDMVSAGLHFFF